MYFSIGNKLSYLYHLKTVAGIIIFNSSLLVDGQVTQPLISLFSFFAISGYLATVSLINDSTRVIEIRTNNFLRNAATFCRLVLHRYVRLTPLFVVTILLSEIVSSLIDSVSIYSQHFRDHLICPQ
jgi:peptidoglycan/LPS O-acetylase OafA/YrhL